MPVKSGQRDRNDPHRDPASRPRSGTRFSPVPTVTFLFTDIEGSTRMWDDRPEVMGDALRAHDALIRDEVSQCRGSVFKHTGDGALAAFPNAADALDAAVRVQRRLRDLSFPAIGSLRVRMGIHSGEVEERDGDFFGPPLNRAARLMSVAHGGQVLVSLVTERLAAGALGSEVRLRELGEYRLRDLSRTERIFQLEAQDLESEFPALATPDLVPNNLPTQMTSFVGRTSDLAEVRRMIGYSRLVTVTGVGGAGKTRLALQVAADIAGEFSDGAWLVELGALSDPDLIDAAVADALGVAQTTGDSLRSLILEHLADRTLLLLIDNCEHMIGEVAELVSQLLSRSSEVRVVATSRELLGVGGEMAYPMRSLSLPSNRRDNDGEDPLEHDAIRLFVERAQAARPDFELAPEQTDTVIEICRRLDGMPLALELAAARLRTFSPRQIADNLDQRFRLLTGGSRSALPRQQTLAAAIDWSYRLLEEKEKLLFERLSVFHGGFTLEAVRSVCTDSGLDSIAVLELLPALVDKSLVTVDTDAEESRFRLLETLRQFARERLDESGRADEFRRYHAEFYRDLAVTAGRHIRGPDEIRWWERVDSELANLRQAMVWALEAGEADLALATAAGFWRYWWFKSRWSEGVAWLDQALAGADDPPKQLRALALLGLGSLLEVDGDRLDEAIDRLEEAVAMWEEIDVEGAASELLTQNYPAALINLSVAYQVSGREEAEVEALNQRALEVGRRIGDPAAEAVALGNLAESAAILGDVEKARDLFDQAIAASERLGSTQRLADLNHQIGFFELNLGSPVRARAAFERSHAYGEKAGLSHVVAGAEARIAVADFDAGGADARPAFDVAIRAYFAHEDIAMVPHIRQETALYRAQFEVDEGAPERAAHLLGAIATEPTALDDLLQGRFDRVRSLVETALGRVEAEEAMARGASFDRSAVTALILGEVSAPPPSVEG